MKRILVITILLLGLSIPSSYGVDAMGSAFGSLTTARAIGQGAGNFGFAVGFADATSFTGSFTYGLSQYTDGRLKLGLIDSDNSDAKLTLGADFKWQFWNYGPGSTHPFDFAVGGFFEFVDLDAASAFQIGGHLIGSYPIVLTRGGTLTPYGRFNARLEALSFDRPVGASGDDSDTNLEVGLSGGVEWKMTTTVSLFGEFQIDGNDGVFLGVDFNVM